ncbi:L-glutamate gamma-semialdehyde dehydrogenase [Psychroflexus lacisalsi]|jgi:1-pyrroline-5-carboxylate dehydrogenase|uniref:L-glutamate gamma-semialdehyde dehydrogenase n=1 Tax=Psychroflexus lacisalsi TaxID=503928 RepID=A0ABN1K627_9FLAO|nr:L-glutamate gamma-semialdehyde dehydrogenase [Psychroflexus lacisalsi]MBZ9619237.1 L-glutamate gamma-semialdehyde dehydrogenase [Psychroflexus lacisalsi]
MGKGYFQVPTAINEPIKTYAPGSPERESIEKMYKKIYSEKAEVPLYIGKEEIKSGKTKSIRPPHDHQHEVGVYHNAEEEHVDKAIDTALEARKEWAKLPWEQRAAVFLKAADLIAGPYRDRMNATTMIGQSKTVFQAEIDSACEICDFLRFNVEYMSEIYREQPESADNEWNRLEHRPLEGFVYAITPFNFTAIAGNLPSSAALMGNVAVWKPSDSQMLSAQVIMEVFKEAGLPDGVINMIIGDPVMITDKILARKEFAGIHFTGSTNVFKGIWAKIGENIHNYNTYPRIVGETGGKDFIVAHKSADAQVVATALLRGAFEFQGQKCSAASRSYVSSSLWPNVKERLVKDVKSIKMGPTGDFGNFMGAVIHEQSFDKLSSFIERAKKSDEAEIIVGGKCDKSKGYFVEPTVIVTTNPQYETMVEELFGPVLTLYVYDDDKFEETLHVVDNTSQYGLTGSIISTDRYAASVATDILQNSAGNFYINDKCTGAVVGRQPFGGARNSGTNDKAGSKFNLLRWSSPRLIKETFVPATDYKYPHMG